MTRCGECGGVGGSHAPNCSVTRAGHLGEPSSPTLPFGGDGQDHPIGQSLRMEGPFPEPGRRFAVRLPGGDAVPLTDIVRGDAAVTLDAAGVPCVTGHVQGPCGRCGGRPGTERWTDTFAATHGMEQWWCRVCVLEAQIEHAEERAAALPELRHQLEVARRALP